MRPVDGYPDSWGAQRASVYPHAGPASYGVVTYSPLAGGDTTSAVEAGMKYIDMLQSMATDSGNFRVIAIPTVSSIGPVGTQMTTVRLKWIALRTATIGGQSQVVNTEAIAASDLSGEIVRLLAIGPK